MPGDWGNLDCPKCGTTHPTPEHPEVECEELIADLICANCHNGWEMRVELWRYYGIEPALPSWANDR